MNVVTTSSGGRDDAPVREPARRTATFASMSTAMNTCVGVGVYAAHPMH